jgi:putative hydrolase of the HAD superfamily
MIKAVIFDLDGTLYDEKRFVMSGFEAVAEYLASKHDLDCNKILEVLKKDFDSGLRRKNFDVLLEKVHLKEDIGELIDIYREHTPTISLHEDAKRILPELSQKYKLGLITDGYKKTQAKKISALGIAKHFDVITLTDTYGRTNWKPSDKPFSVTLTKLVVKPAESIYVGDDPTKDFLGAKKLGVHTVRIRRGSGEYDHLNVDDQHEADSTISSLVMLEEIIDRINQKERNE